MSPRRPVWGAWAALALAGCPAGDLSRGQACLYDRDCEGSLICIDPGEGLDEHVRTCRDPCGPEDRTCSEAVTAPGQCLRCEGLDQWFVDRPYCVEQVYCSQPHTG